MAALVNDVVSNSPQTSIDLRKLTFGVSDTDSIMTFSKARIPMSIAALVQSILGGPIDLSNSVRTLLTNTLTNPNGSGGIGLTQASVDVQSNTKILLGATARADFSFPFPLTVRIGRVEVRNVDLDGVEFVQAALDGVGLKTGGEMSLKADVGIRSGEGIAGKLATIVSAYTMKGGPGKSAATLHAGSILMGETASDVITIFSKLRIAIPVDAVVGPIAKFADDGLTSLLSGFGGNVISTNPDGSLKLTLGKDLGVTVEDCKVGFDAGSVIRAGLKGGLEFPLSISAKVPFFGVGIGFDETLAFDVGVSGVDVVGKGRSELNVDARIGVMDSEPLADKIAVIADAFFQRGRFPGDLVIRGLRIGEGEGVGAFSKVEVPIGFDRLVEALVGGVGRGIDVLALLKEFGFGMERVDVGLPEARTLRANLSVKFGNRMPFSVELPYLSANLGLENTDVFDVNFNKPFSLARGNQSTEMDISLRFPSSPTVQNAVKSFSENLYTQGWGKTTEKIALSSLKLGYSSTDYIRAFRKARLGLPTSSVLSLETVNFILNQLGFPNGVTDINDGKAMLDRIDIQGANLDFSSPGVVKMTCSVLLRRVPFNLKAFFPYFFFNLNLRGQEFMKFTILNLDVKPENANDLRSDLGIELRFTESPGLKNEVADVVDQMQKGKRVEGLFAAYGIALGPNAADSIDAFSLLVGELFIYRATNPGNSLFNDLLGSLQLNDIALAIQDEKTMVADVESTLKSPLPNIFTKIPYLYLEVLVDGKPLALLEARDVAFDNGKVLAKAFIEWPRDEATAQKAADVASNVLFRRFDAPKSVIKFSKLRFGATKETAFTFVDTTLIDFDLARLIRSVNDYVNTPGQTLELTDIQTTLTEKGVKCYITGTKLPKDIPFRSFKGAGGTAKVMWAPQGRIESYIVDVFFQNIYFAPNEVFSFELDVIVNAKEAEDAISVILPRFIQWKPYLLGVLLGHATFTSGSPYDPNSKVFRSFDKVTVVAPELFFYKPLLVEPKLLNPFTQGLGLRINLYFANPGPLHVELGNIGARVYDSSKEVGSVNIALNTKNNLEGGNRPMGNLIPIIVKIDLGLRNIINLIFNPKRYRLQWFNDRNGLSAPWLINVLNNIPEDIGSELLPIILAVLRHIEIKLGPFNIDPFPDVFNKKADKYLAMAGNNVMFGAIDAMPEAFAPMVVNATGARNVSVVANEVVTTMFVPSASVTRTTTLTSYSTATILP